MTNLPEKLMMRIKPYFRYCLPFLIQLCFSSPKTHYVDRLNFGNNWASRLLGREHHSSAGSKVLRQRQNHLPTSSRAIRLTGMILRY